MPNITERAIHTSRTTSGFVDLMPCSKTRHGLYPTSASEVKGPHATIIEQAGCDDEESSLGFIIPCAAGEALRVGICTLSYNQWPKCKWNDLTAKNSVARKYPPPPFLPFKATIAPGYIRVPPLPRTPPRILSEGSRRRATRAPDENIREDSIIMAPSVSLDIASVSASCVIRPTTQTSS